MYRDRERKDIHSKRKEYNITERIRGEQTENSIKNMLIPEEPSLQVWDGVSGRCVQTFSKCHDGMEVCSVLFSRNGKVGVLPLSTLKKL